MLIKVGAVANFGLAQPLALACFFLITACDKKSANKGGEVVSQSASVGSVPARSNRGNSRADFPELLRLAAQDPSLRKGRYKDLIVAGVPADQAEFVLDSILANVGPGQDRNDLLQAFFFHSSLSLKEGLDFIRVRLDGAESDSAFLGLACRIGLNGNPALLDEISNLGLGLSAREIHGISSGLAIGVDPNFNARVFGLETNSISHSQSDKDRDFNEAFRVLGLLLGHQKPEVACSVYSDFIDNTARSAPFEAWKKLGELAVAFPDLTSSKDLARGIVANMVDQDPELAFDTISKSKTGEISSISSVAFDAWLKKDATTAFAWLENRSSELIPEQSNGCRSSVVKYYLSSGEIDLARKFASAITDQDLLSGVEGKIWEAERGILRKEVGKDPSGTIQSIVSGRSKYGDYWIEEAMGTWISKDFDKAQSWYQDNWNKLPATKSQFLAAAFAKQATGQGDTSTARQWAAYIQDPKTKQRIEAGIAKAEAAKNH